MRIKTIISLSVALILISFAVMAQTSNEYDTVYKQGSAPFTKGTKIRIAKRDDGYQFFPLVNQAWTIQMGILRGAVANESGIWVYWFDGTENTLSAFFESKDRQFVLADEMNAAIKNYQTTASPVTQEQLDEYRQRYEAYKVEALKQSR